MYIERSLPYRLNVMYNLSCFLCFVHSRKQVPHSVLWLIFSVLIMYEETALNNFYLLRYQRALADITPGEKDCDPQWVKRYHFHGRMAEMRNSLPPPQCFHFPQLPDKALLFSWMWTGKTCRLASFQWGSSSSECSAAHTTGCWLPSNCLFTGSPRNLAGPASRR